MSGRGAPELTLEGVEDVRVVVVAACWHTEVMDGLVAGANRALSEVGSTPAALVRVPGSFELPVAVARAARSGRYDGIVALGVVVRGGTPHFDYVCQAATSGLTQVSIDTGVPVGFGVLTCDTDEQARQRAGLPGSQEDKGHEAARAVLATAATLRSLDEGSHVAV